MRPPAILLLAALAAGCADTAGPTPDAGKAAAAPALPAAAKLPHVVYYVISEA